MIEDLSHPVWADVVAPPPGIVNLIRGDCGAEAIQTTDDFFAPMDRMLNPEPPVFFPNRFDEHGKWMDGWESRRRRGLGHDWTVVRLMAPGQIRALDIDTNFFTGNFPRAASVEACFTGGSVPDEATDWVEILAPQELSGDAHHRFPVISGSSRNRADDQIFDYVRLHIYPDGGVARFRVYGQAKPDWAAMAGGKSVELSALRSGGMAMGWSNAHYGDPSVILKAGKAANMGDGWETRRRRSPGCDWILIALGCVGEIEELEIDTSHFRGNFPQHCSVQAANLESHQSDLLAAQAEFWTELLPKTEMQADFVHRFGVADLKPVGPVNRLRLNMHPDGGIGRFRVHGRPQ